MVNSTEPEAPRSTPPPPKGVSPYPEVVNAQRNGSDIKLKHCFIWDDARDNLGIDFNVPRFVQWYFEHRIKSQPPGETKPNDVLAGLAKRVHDGVVLFFRAEDWASLYYLGCVRDMPNNLSITYAGPAPLRQYESDLNDVF